MYGNSTPSQREGYAAGPDTEFERTSVTGELREDIDYGANHGRVNIVASDWS